MDDPSTNPLSRFTFTVSRDNQDRIDPLAPDSSVSINGGWRREARNTGHRLTKVHLPREITAAVVTWASA